jgi:transcriptional regulator with XRE-family HTH domain
LEKTIHTPASAAFVRRLISLREAAGMTQRDLAKRLKRAPSVVARIETGERRLDVIEFIGLCRALGQKPDKLFRGLVQDLSALAIKKR